LIFRVPSALVAFPSSRVVMLGYVGCGCGLLGVILSGVGAGIIISGALETSREARDGFVGQVGQSGEFNSPGFGADFGPLIILRVMNETDTPCKTMFDGLGKPYLKSGGNNDTLNPWNCAMFNGVTDVDGKCEMELKNICDDAPQPHNCGLLQAVASMDYPSCKEDDCPFSWQTVPWAGPYPSFDYALTSEYKVSAVPRGTCVFGSQTIDRILEIFNNEENSIYRMLFWAGLVLLAIGIGACVASCCVGGGSRSRNEAGAELMS